MDGFTYKIKDWGEKFFIKRDALKNRAGKPPWISVRTHHDGYAIRQISVSPGGTEAYGAFILIAAVVAKTDTEHGRLVDDARVLTPERLAVRTGFPAAGFARAAVILERVGWLERMPVPEGVKGTFGSDSPDRAAIYDELAQEWRTHKPVLQHGPPDASESLVIPVSLKKTGLMELPPGPEDDGHVAPTDRSKELKRVWQEHQATVEALTVPPDAIPEPRRRDAGETPETLRNAAGQSADNRRPTVRYDTDGTDVIRTDGTNVEKETYPQTPFQGASVCFYCAIPEGEAERPPFAVNVISQDVPDKQFPVCDICSSIVRGRAFRTDTEARWHIHWTLWTSGRARYIDAREKRFGGKEPTGSCPSTVRPGTGPLGGAPEVVGDPLFDSIKTACFGSGTNPGDERRIKKALTALNPKNATAEQVADRFARLKRTHPERLPTLEILVKQWDALAPQGPTLDWKGV